MQNTETQQNFYIYGCTGQAKTSVIQISFPKDLIYDKGSGNKPWFDGVAGQKLFLYDDADPHQLNLGDIKRLAGSAEIIGEIKH